MKKIIIRVFEKDNPEGKEVEVQAYQTKGGLAINRSVDKWNMPTDFWNITHIKSGLAICHRLNKINIAREIFNRVAPLADWTKSSSEIVQDVSLGTMVQKIRAEVEKGSNT